MICTHLHLFSLIFFSVETANYHDKKTQRERHIKVSVATTKRCSTLRLRPGLFHRKQRFLSSVQFTKTCSVHARDSETLETTVFVRRHKMTEKHAFSHKILFLLKGLFSSKRQSKYVNELFRYYVAIQALLLLFHYQCRAVIRYFHCRLLLS